MKLKLELQHFNGCPNSPLLIARVKEAIKDFDNIDYQEILIDSNDKAQKHKFRGSPTLLINDVDFENIPPPLIPSLACRWYSNGLPTVEDIKKKIEYFKA